MSSTMILMKRYQTGLEADGTRFQIKMLVKFLMNFIIPNGLIKGSKIINDLTEKISLYLVRRAYKKRVKIHNNELNLRSFTSKDLTISITSFPDRINQIELCIQSIINQTVKPTRLILWLAQDQFKNIEIPHNLRKLEDYGLEIIFCEDYRSHKKYYESLSRWPEDILITLDDDVIYPEDTIEKLLETHAKHPKDVVCFRAHEIKFNNGLPLPYSKWNFTSPGIKGPSKSLFPIGVGGVLYPPNSLDKRVLEKDIFMNDCFHADDLWLKVMSLLKGTSVIKVVKYNKSFFTIPETQRMNLNYENVVEGRNDSQLEQLFKRFGLCEKNFRDY